MPGSQHQPWVLLPSFSPTTIIIITIIIITTTIPTTTTTIIITILYIDPHGDHDDPGVLHRGQRSRQANAGEASRDTFPCLEDTQPHLERKPPCQGQHSNCQICRRKRTTFS